MRLFGFLRCKGANFSREFPSSLEKVLFIGMVWPEPTSTAAGGRIRALLELFIAEDYSVHFACAAGFSDRSQNLEELGVTSHEIILNSSSFNELLEKEKPDIVVFDRFITEEQFGWRVADVCPQAFRILDTEDLHFLRTARQKSVKKYGDLSKVDLYSNATKRELASILRCDMSLIISEFELNLLLETFKVSSDLLVYHPISFPSITEAHVAEWPSYESRSGFMTIGNFKHAPNLDAVKFTKAYVWPEIKKLLPDAEMHVYGAYLDENSLAWNIPTNEFYLHGAVPSADEVFRKSRVCLAPLRFGAGLKGKLLRAALNGTPSITTEIGAEGISSDSEWPGLISNDPKVLARHAVELHNNQSIWEESVKKGSALINTKFNKQYYGEALFKELNYKIKNLESQRKEHFIGAVLQFHTLRSTEFMSRWIEEKNKEKES